jgi:hypothetical protein
MFLLRLSIACIGALLAITPVLGQDVELLGPTSFRLPPIDSGVPVIAEEIVPAAEELPVPEEVLPPEDGDWWMLPASWYKPWEGSAELGLNGSEGNSQTFNIRSGAKAKYSQPWVEQVYEIIHVDNSADGVKTASNGFFDGRLTFPFTGTAWSTFAHARLEYDEFRDYDLRVSGDAGLAYDWWKIDASKLQTRAGLSTSREIGGAENRFNPELTFGIDLAHKFDDRQKVSITMDYYPTIDDFTDYRINTNASWEIVVSQAWGLSAKLSVIDRYDNTPQGKRPNDLNYAALMLWAF